MNGGGDSVRVGPEIESDEESIRAVHVAAFPTTAEADLVGMLKEGSDAEISLVARQGGRIVGHVLISRMRVEGSGRNYRALGLAPVAVLPEYHGLGIGTALIAEALKTAEHGGNELVFVVGEPDYYRRFGFSTEAAAPFASPYAGPYFMAKAFDIALPASGTAAYAPAFAKLS